MKRRNTKHSPPRRGGVVAPTVSGLAAQTGWSDRSSCFAKLPLRLRPIGLALRVRLRPIGLALRVRLRPIGLALRVRLRPIGLALRASPPLRGGECTRLHKFVLCVLCLFGATPFSSFAQAIYAENQIPARGVSVDYVLTIKNPMSHLYDVEIQIKGIRESSVSVSMPAWSPGIYRIENYARNVQD